MFLDFFSDGKPTHVCDYQAFLLSSGKERKSGKLIEVKSNKATKMNVSKSIKRKLINN